MKSVGLILVLVACASADMFRDAMEAEWKAFKMQHSKVYRNHHEESTRFTTYMKNKKFVEEHNALYHAGLKSFSLAMNKFGDMESTEFGKLMNGLRINLSEKRQKRKFDVIYCGFLIGNRISISYQKPAVNDVKSIDWRDSGAVTEIKDQGNCGSCWAFSATGSLEGQHFLKKGGSLVSLSEQNLVDCSGNYGNHGCSGGWMDGAFDYIIDNHGIDKEELYPYEARELTCRYKEENKGSDEKSYVDIPEGDEEALQAAIANEGPVSVAIDASNPSFQLYYKGVYDEPSCSPINLCHAVLAVGYDSTEDGTDYYIVKNSWGLTWGDNGYIKMKRNANNTCGIATASSYPTL